jgi:hypothetical protein
VMSRLVPLADLCLAELHGHGPAMIGASAGDLFGPLGFYDSTFAVQMPAAAQACWTWVICAGEGVRACPG